MRLIDKTKSKFLLIATFFFFLFSKETQLNAQVDFSNPILTTDCCPIAKQRIDSIMNNAPYVFEGRMIKFSPGNFYDSYLFEIEKVYRGGKLQSGTVEIITRMPMFGGEPPLIVFAPARYIIFAKETDFSDVFDANNSVKLEVFYHDEIRITSYIREMTKGNYYTSGFSLKFPKKGDVQSFLADYNLFPTDIPKADTLKILSKREIEAAKEKVIRDAEEALKQEQEILKRTENKKRQYRRLLESKLELDSIAGIKTQKTVKQESIENAMRQFENAPDSIRNRLLKDARLEERRSIERILDANAEKKNNKKQRKSTDTATLTVSLQNIALTNNTIERFLEFDIVIQADRDSTYLLGFHSYFEYLTNHLGIPFSENIYDQDPQEIWITPNSFFTGTNLHGNPKFEVYDGGEDAFTIIFTHGHDGDNGSLISTQDMLFAHIKMKINGNYEGLSIIEPNVWLAFYNTSPITDIANSERYKVK